MKLSILQENLSKAIDIASKAAATRSTLPVLSNLLLSVANNRLRISATNLDLGINTWTGCATAIGGEITIPARLLSDFVNSLPPDRIDLELDEGSYTLNLQCGRYESNIKGIDAQEFPVVPSISDDDIVVEFDPAELRKFIKRVVFAVQTDESRPVFSGVLIRCTEDALTMVAADGFRLAVQESGGESIAATLKGAGLMAGGEHEMIIPGHALKTLAQIARDEIEPVRMVVTPSRRQVIFGLSTTELVSQLIEGEFPDYTRIIPKGHTTRVLADTDQLLGAVKVAHLFARDSNNIVKMAFTPNNNGDAGQITLTARSIELGDNETDLPADIDGDAIEIAFNTKYLIDVLSVLDSDHVEVSLSSPSAPGVVRPEGDQGYTHVIMPMHIQGR